MSASSHQRLYIFGASGSGTTTLGRAVASELSLTHVDCDDHFWARTETPFSVKRKPPERISTMSKALGGDGWVLTGACHGWGGELLERAHLIVFVTLPTPLRMRRLRAREKARFGDRIEKGGDMFDIHKGFIQWAQGYDSPDFQGRNLANHEEWLAQQSKPVCRIEGDQTVEDAKLAVLSALQSL